MELFLGSSAKITMPQKPIHVGYCISCYGDDSYVFSAPISVSRDEARALLNRKWMINGEPLTQNELIALRPYLLYEVEVGWDENLNFYLEGSNLSASDDEWS